MITFSIMMLTAYAGKADVELHLLFCCHMQKHIKCYVSTFKYAREALDVTRYKPKYNRDNVIQKMLE